jgi:UDP-N-acetylmuramate dehydrogenase
MLIKKDQKLSEYTTSKIGGLVEMVCFPKTILELVEALVYCFKTSKAFYILGKGSNTIFPDKDINYNQVIINTELLNNMTVEDNIIRCQSGVILQNLVDQSLENNLLGLTGLNRIPGTIGGAVFGNAGAYGVEIGNYITEVKAMDINKLSTNLILFGEDLEFLLQKSLVTFDEYDIKDNFFSYRSSHLKENRNLLIVEVALTLTTGSEEKMAIERESYNEIATKRDDFYPKNLQSPGSLFKNITNPPKNVPKDWIVYNKLPVAKLLESLNSKSRRFGDVGMRKEHANILMNYSNGKYEDVVNLINAYTQEVKDKYDIDIEAEVQIIKKDFGKNNS